MKLTLGVTAVLLVLVCTAPIEAQFDNGQISGFVRDASGAVVPGVVVTATNEATRQQREAVSNADGYYVFPGLIVGTYTVSAELQGFSRSTTTGVRLNSAARLSVNIALEVGALTDSVEVSADCKCDGGERRAGADRDVAPGRADATQRTQPCISGAPAGGSGGRPTERFRRHQHRDRN